MELIKLDDKARDLIRNASRKDQKILQIKDALDEEVKEMKGVALGLYE